MAIHPERAHRHDLDHEGDRDPAAQPTHAGHAPDLGAAAAAVDVVQARESGGGGEMVLTDETSKRESAAQGFSGTGQALPHLDRIQESFGSGHDLSGVKAHVGGEAASASKSIGADGFASGDKVAFKEQPDLHLAAHEAAHVVQQREGVHLKGGVGQAGDSHEQAADAVADRVVAGESASDLLPAGKPTVDAGSSAMQLYTEEKIGGAKWRVSESGKTALKQGDGNQTLYATTDLVDEANTALAGAGENGSFLTLVASGKTMEVKGQELHHVAPEMKPTGTDPKNQLLVDSNKPGGKDSEGNTGDTMALWADCGRSSRTVMGTDGRGKAPHAEFSVGSEEWTTGQSYSPDAYSDAIYLKTMPEFLKLDAGHPHMKKDVHYTGDLEYLWDPIVPTTAHQAREQYWELGEDGRRMFDKFASINTAANPEIGGAYTMNTEYKMPGSDVVREDDGTAKMRWNFHWGGVVMKDGANNVTLENYAVMFAKTGDKKKDEENAKRAYDWTNRGWNYQMYGTVKEGQTFHEQHLETGTHGTRASTFAAKVDD
jgi:hypothetical protein